MEHKTVLHRLDVGIFINKPPRSILRGIDDGPTMGRRDVMNDFSNTKAADDVTGLESSGSALFDVAGRKQPKTAFASTLSDLLHDHVAWKVPGQHTSKLLHTCDSAVLGRSGLDKEDKGYTCVPSWCCHKPDCNQASALHASNMIDITDLSTDTRVVAYDPDFAREQVMKINAQQHTQDTTDALNTLQAPPPSSTSHPPEWKGCKNIYCVRKCGWDGKHLKEDGSPGGRGACRLRAPPPAYCPPSGQPTFEQAKQHVKKRKREESPSCDLYEENAAWRDLEEGATAQAPAAQPSEMETLRIAVERLQEENGRLLRLVDQLSREVNSIHEWKARTFAAFMPSSN